MSRLDFNIRYPEKEQFNQYWFSPLTMQRMIEEIESVSAGQEHFKIACISTPSLYYILPESLKSQAKVFDIDEAFAREPGFVRYTFEEPLNVPEDLHGYFDLAIIDPPFITEAVWQNYAQTARLILKPEGKIIGTSIAENAEMLRNMLELKATPFKPSIPHLIYQYNAYTNYEPHKLNEPNPEIVED